MINSKQDIVEGIERLYSEMYNWMKEQDDDQFLKSAGEKWSTAEHFDHLIIGMKALNKAIDKPRFLLRYLFGKPNRKGRSYEELKNRYNERLAKADTSNNAFSSKNVSSLEKNGLLNEFKKLQEVFLKKMGKWDERNLDRYLLPHPLLGKVSVREMFFFMHLHHQHHFDAILRDYSKD